ncbi:CCA tRNA nucleotidyltransferase [Paenibacillus segetis]|uniref:CCA-adding enzyme n=1 Tax=Paenibacillus segetis TaxID=1325360 RepID=A0ABQ1YG93_9BACL|nr:CCA tRNA nucleotidyltransferase [Paenibacillus segetis]GGH24185.1 CCA-adding enzyme [Paenibacillus segetis]
MISWKQVDPLMQRQGEEVLRKLLESGFQGYFVGGCVRDELMGRPVHDMDIATSANPEQVIELFERTVPTGIQHGTVTVLMADYHFEVTTFRKESSYGDHRRPLSVEYVDDITEDLQRRDFTMNAIARDIDGTLIDPFHGREDIELGVIRCVGIAAERFDEDALRMMRGIRFTANFAFRPVKSMWRALLEGRDKLSFIAMERIRVELEKIVLGVHPLRGLALIERSGLLHYVKVPVILPSELRRDLLEAIVYVQEEDSEIRWSLLVQGLDISGAEVSRLMKAWTFSNSVAQSTSEIVLFDEAWSEIRSKISLQNEEQLRINWVQLQVRFGKPVAARWLKRQTILLRECCMLDTTRSGTELRALELTCKWHEGVTVHSVQDLAVSGSEVLFITGKKAGPWLGELMKQWLLSVAMGEIPNEKELLLEQAKAVVNLGGR